MKLSATSGSRDMVGRPWVGSFPAFGKATTHRQQLTRAFSFALREELNGLGFSWFIPLPKDATELFPSTSKPDRSFSKLGAQRTFPRGSSDAIDGLDLDAEDIKLARNSVNSNGSESVSERNGKPRRFGITANSASFHPFLSSFTNEIETPRSDCIAMDDG